MNYLNNQAEMLEQDKYNYYSAELNPEYNYRIAEIGPVNRSVYEYQQSEIVGKVDSRTRIIKTANSPFRYICQIVTRKSNGTQWVGSGFFIGPRTILTAGHVVWDEYINKKIPNSMIFVTPARNGASKPFGTVCPINVVPSYSGFSNSDLANIKDYAIIHLSAPLGSTTGYFGRGKWEKDSFGSSILTGGRLPVSVEPLKLNVCGYPGDKGGITQYSSFNYSFSLRQNGRILSYLNDTKGGQSGGPVWIKRHPSLGGRVVVGIHIAAGPRATAPSGTVLYNRAIFISNEVKTFIDGNMR
jgi:V8-like Glu-specific endopeptidase